MRQLKDWLIGNDSKSVFIPQFHTVYYLWTHWFWLHTSCIDISYFGYLHSIYTPRREILESINVVTLLGFSCLADFVLNSHLWLISMIAGGLAWQHGSEGVIWCISIMAVCWRTVLTLYWTHVLLQSIDSDIWCSHSRRDLFVAAETARLHHSRPRCCPRRADVTQPAAATPCVRLRRTSSPSCSATSLLTTSSTAAAAAETIRRNTLRWVDSVICHSIRLTTTALRRVY